MKSPKATIDFSEKGVVEDLDRLKKLARTKFAANAKRSDFYKYLGEVYRWVLAWGRSKKLDELRSHVAKQLGHDVPRTNADAFYLVVQATSPKPIQTNSKYAIALANADLLNISGRGFEEFLAEIGGPTTICTRDGLSTVGKIQKAKKVRRRK